MTKLARNITKFFGNYLFRIKQGIIHKKEWFKLLKFVYSFTVIHHSKKIIFF